MATNKLEKLIAVLGNKPSDADAKQALQLALPILLDTIQKLEDRIQKIDAEKKITVDVPEIRFPESVKMDLRGISVVSIKGDRGERGLAGQNGKDGKSIQGEKGADGISPNPQEIIQEVIKQLPPPAITIPPTGDETIEVINSDNTEKKIKKERVEGLEEIEKIARQKGGIMMGGGGNSGGGGRIVKTHDLSASLNGSTKTFLLPAFWRVLLVLSSSFPYGAARETTDWTSDANAATITFTSEIDAATTLQQGQSLLILYAEA